MKSSQFDFEAAKQAFKDERYSWQRHALQRVSERGLRQSAVIAAILDGQLVEEYPQDYPLPSALILGWDAKRPLHVVAAWDEEAEWAYVVTVYTPDEEHFEADYRTRRSRQ